jgi:ribosomal protein S18 acetylase RimI-like enzyme
MGGENKISSQEIRIEVLSEAHREILREFQSYEKDLSDFLVEDALENQRKNVSVTYLWFHIGTGKLLGYITLLSDSLALKKLDPKLKESFRMKGIDYPTLPALKIGRVCIDDRYRRKGIGTQMFYFTLNIMIQLNYKVGCRFITLDAKENRDDQKNNSVHFYKKLGFGFLKEKNKKHPPMYYDAFKIMKELSDKFISK